MQFIDVDAKVPVPSTPEPEVVPISLKFREEVEQCNEGSSSQSNIFLERPRRVLKKSVRLIVTSRKLISKILIQKISGVTLIEEMEGRNFYVENSSIVASVIAQQLGFRTTVLT